MQIYNQCRKQFCCLIFFGTCDIFSGFFDKYKVKKNSVYSKYKCCVTIQKFGVSTFFKESNTFIHKGCVKWIKGDSKDLYCEKSIF